MYRIAIFVLFLFLSMSLAGCDHGPEPAPDKAAPDLPGTEVVSDSIEIDVDLSQAGSLDDLGGPIQADVPVAVAGGAAMPESVVPDVPPEHELVVDDLGPDYWAQSVVSIQDVLAMTDAEATIQVGHIDRKVLHTAWGSPDVEYVAGSYEDDMDVWHVDGPDGMYQVGACYDWYDFNVSEVIVRGPSAPSFDAGLSAADVLDDPEGSLDAMLAMGLTRRSIRLVLGEPEAYWTSPGYVVQGDVFRIDGPDGSMFVCVGYKDDKQHTLPVSLDVYRADGPDGPLLSPPWPYGEAIYVPGVYNFQVEGDPDPWAAEWDECNTWRRGVY